MSGSKEKDLKGLACSDQYTLSKQDPQPQPKEDQKRGAFQVVQPGGSTPISPTRENGPISFAESNQSPESTFSNKRTVDCEIRG